MQCNSTGKDSQKLVPGFFHTYLPCTFSLCQVCFASMNLSHRWNFMLNPASPPSDSLNWISLGDPPHTRWKGEFYFYPKAWRSGMMLSLQIFIPFTQNICFICLFWYLIPSLVYNAFQFPPPFHSTIQLVTKSVWTHWAFSSKISYFFLSLCSLCSSFLECLPQLSHWQKPLLRGFSWEASPLLRDRVGEWLMHGFGIR